MWSSSTTVREILRERCAKRTNDAAKLGEARRLGIADTNGRR